MGVHDFDGKGHYANYIFMWSIGRKDIKGNELYDKDIVKEKIGFGTPSKAPKNRPFVYAKGVVDWNEDDAGFVITYKYNWEQYWKSVEGNATDWYRMHYGWKEVEKVGNVFENPDLLTK
jgi:hypothetical protein